MTDRQIGRWLEKGKHPLGAFLPIFTDELTMHECPPSSPHRHCHHGMANRNILGTVDLAVLKDPMFLLSGCFAVLFPLCHRVGGWGGAGPIPRPWGHFETNTLGSEVGVGQPSSQSQLLGELKHTCRLTDVKYTPLHSGVPILPSSLLREHPFALVPERSLHLKRSHRHCCWPGPGFLFSLHICESPCPLAKQPNPRHTLGPWFMETGFFKNLPFLFLFPTSHSRC